LTVKPMQPDAAERSIVSFAGVPSDPLLCVSFM